MTPEALLSWLAVRGVRLYVNGGTLRARAPKGVLTASLIEHLRSRKPELTAFVALNWISEPRSQAGGFVKSEDLNANVWARRAAALLAAVSDADRRADFREVFEHRAGVAEFDGGLSRTEAERSAYAELRAAMRAAGEISDLT